MINQKTLELANELKQSKQYQEFFKCKESIDQDDFLKRLVDEYKKISLSANAYVVAGSQIPEEINIRLESVYQMLMQSEEAQNYFIAQHNLDKLLGDIIQALASSVGLEQHFLNE